MMTSGLSGPTPAIFLDRDGTLIEDRGYLRTPAEAIVYPETFAALRSLQARFKLFIVTNQSGIAKGLITRAEADAVNSHLVALLREQDIRIVEVFCCPHHRADGCQCIKPQRYFADQAALRHNLDLPRSYAIGDHPHDVEFGRNLGGRGIYVLTGHGARHQSELRGDAVIVSGIGEAARWILSQSDQPAGPADAT